MADDVHASVSSAQYQTAVAALSQHAEDAITWDEERQLEISAPKFHVTLFSSDTHQYRNHPHVTMKDSPLPLSPNPKILGSDN